MKKLLLSLTIFGAMFSANAGVITVSNNPNSPGQYTDLQLAIDNAIAGDTLLVAGSPTSYGNVTINSKELHIVGIGHDPNKQVPYKTLTGSISIGTSGVSLSANGTTIEGISASTIGLVGQLANQLSNIEVFRCKANISVSPYVSGVLVYNNIISIVDIAGHSSVSNITVQNNIITGFYSRGGSIDNGNVTVRNNLFIGSGAGTALNSRSDNTLFANNIFYGRSPFRSDLEHCTFNNNISYNTPNDNFNITGTNSGGSNIIGQDPQFILESNFSFDVDDDFNVATSSPIINAGTDGTDLGIYGGSYPWPEGGASGSGNMYSQEPQSPQVNEMNIQNAVLPNTQMLDVQVKGITND